jgi:hypothetical protein
VKKIEGPAIKVVDAADLEKKGTSGAWASGEMAFWIHKKAPRDILTRTLNQIEFPFRILHLNSRRGFGTPTSMLELVLTLVTAEFKEWWIHGKEPSIWATFCRTIVDDLTTLGKLAHSEYKMGLISRANEGRRSRRQSRKVSRRIICNSQEVYLPPRDQREKRPAFLLSCYSWQ